MSRRPPGYQAICVLCKWVSDVVAREKRAFELAQAHVCPLAVA